MYVCPACFSLHETIVPEYPFCPECNCDLPGDVDLILLQDFRDKVSKSRLEEIKVSIRDAPNLRLEYKRRITDRLQVLLEMP